MAIHHAITKRAEKAGVILTEVEGSKPTTYSAHWPKLNKRLQGESAKYLLDDMVTIILMENDYASFAYTINDDNTVDIRVRGTDISVTGLRAQAAFNKAKELWQASREELDEDDEEADAETEAEVAEEIEEEDGKSGSVVNEKYRIIYKETGRDGVGSGDWLDNLLAEHTANKAGTNIELFEQICAANGVDTAKYRHYGNGWQGRLRMTGRNLLAKAIWIANGKLRMPEGMSPAEYTAPADWMAIQKYKVPKGTKQDGDVSAETSEPAPKKSRKKAA
jgi:hypothetical protein